MGSFNANFQTQLDSRQNAPCFVFALATASGMDGSWAYYSGVVPSGAPSPSNWKPYLRDRVRAGGQTLNQKEGTIGSGSLAVEILSTADDFLNKVVATEKPSGAGALRPTVGLWMGFRSLAFTDWVRIWVGKLRDVDLRSDGTVWRVTCNSLLDELRNDCMVAADGEERLLNADLDSWDTSDEPDDWTVTTGVGTNITKVTAPSLTRLGEGAAALFSYGIGGNTGELKQARGGFAASTYYAFEFWAKGSALNLPFQIGVKNLTTGNWLTAASGTGPTAASTWGAGPAYLTATPGDGVYARTIIRFKTEATANPGLEFYIRGSDAALGNATVYVDDASVSQKVVARGNPVNLALNLIGTPATVDADFPVEWLAGDPSGVGLAVTMSAGTTSQVAGYTFQTDRDAFYTGQVVEARFDEPTPAMSILEEDFTRLWGYLYSNLKAEVAFRGWHPPVPPTTPVSWTNDVLTSVPDWTRRQDLRLNRIVISGDWDKQSGDYVELARVEDTAAIDADGLAEMVVESKWLRTEHDGVTLAEARASRLALRTFRAPEELRCDTLFSQIDMGVGEEVQITQAQLPNLATGARGKVTELYEIVSVDANYPEAESQATLLRSYYNRPAFIAPNGQPNYTSATEAQRQFAYICNSSGLMSNGDKGYVVQ